MCPGKLGEGRWLFKVTFEISKADCNGNGISLGVCKGFSGGSLFTYAYDDVVIQGGVVQYY